MMELGEKALANGAQRIYLQVKANIIDSGRVDTYRMHGMTRLSKRSNSLYEVRTSVPYAVYQEYGVGPFGPKRAKALRFKPKGANGYVFAKRVKGFKGAFFYTKAIRSARISWFKP